MRRLAPAPWPGHGVRVSGQAGAHELLAAERASTLERLSGLEREFSGIVESAGPGGTDDEHDPEGATTAFERQHVAALVSQAREHLTQIDAAMARLAEGSYGRCEDCGRARSALPGSPPARWPPGASAAPPAVSRSWPIRTAIGWGR